MLEREVSRITGSDANFLFRWSFVAVSTLVSYSFCSLVAAGITYLGWEGFIESYDETMLPCTSENPAGFLLCTKVLRIACGMSLIMCFIGEFE
jgi:hypothetical protein